MTPVQTNEIKRSLRIARDAIKSSELAGANQAEMWFIRIALKALIHAIEEAAATSSRVWARLRDRSLKVR